MIFKGLCYNEGMKKGLKYIFIAVCATSVLAIGGGVCIYKYVVPSVVSSHWVHEQIKKEVAKIFDAELVIENPKLRTHLNPNIEFSVDKICLTKNKQEVLNLAGINTEFSLKDIFVKRLIVKKLLADNVYINVSDLISLLPQTEKQQENLKSEFDIDIYSAILGVKKCLITYETSDIGVKFDSQKILLDRTKEKKYLHFDFDFELSNKNDKILISANDKNRIYMGNGELHVDKFPIEIDDSKVVIDAFGSRKTGLEINIASKKFKACDIYNIITSNIVIPNGKELLAPIVDVKGNVDFNLHLSKNKIMGDINVNESEFKLKDLLYMPVKITQGLVEIGNKDIKLSDFKGYYNDKKNNSIVMSGDVKNYWKTCDTKIVSDIFVNDDFFRNYLTKMLGAPINLVGDAGSRLTLTSKNGSCDVVWYFLLKEGEGFKLGDESMVLKDYKTLFKVDLSVVKNILKINTIDYYITNELKKEMTPVLAISGNLDLADNMKLLDIKLDIPRALPSEFLNFLACQKIFKKGTIVGNLSIDNRGEFPKMAGVITLEKVRIPAQRLYIKSAKIGAKGDKLGAIAEGKFKRSNYQFDGYVVNDLRLPIVVKSVNLTVDSVDIEKMLAINSATPSPNTLSQVAGESGSGFQAKPEQDKYTNSAPLSTNTLPQGAVESTSEPETSDSDDIPTFTKGLIIVEKCMLNLDKGKYKDILFGNIHANLTQDKDGVLEVQSNKFDIAGGISTLKVKADLIKQLYYLRLGINGVDSDIMASSILGLPREISGKARGLIELNSDKTLKLNGIIKFDIKNGTIEKVGYVEYILKAASLFRNPLAMISPATLSDLVTIPSGNFDYISGDMAIKDNVITKMKIKSSAKQLSSFIIGRYNLETNDAILRIYTKMSNKGEGFAGILRNFSLNSIANRISASGRNDSNYYSAELEQLPKIDVDEKDCQVFLTTVDGDVINFNFLSSLKRIK